MTGKDRRLGRLLKGPNRRCLMVPLDHGPWLGPVQGIDRPRPIVQQVLAGGANALLVSPGVTRAVEPIIGPDIGIVLRVSITLGLAPEARQETPVATAETALCLDADAVAVSIFFGRGEEVATMRFLGQLTEQCYRFGMPVLAEMMPMMDSAYDAKAIAHAARIGFEMGADIDQDKLLRRRRSLQGCRGFVARSDRGCRRPKGRQQGRRYPADGARSCRGRCRRRSHRAPRVAVTGSRGHSTPDARNSIPGSK